jgi:hypothetical protein
MRRNPLIPALAGLLIVQSIVPRATDAASIRPLAFSEVVAKAAVIVRGRVVGTRSFRNVQGRAAERAQRASQSPQTAADGAALGAVQAPTGLAAEGTGRMIFTTVDVEVASFIKGSGGSIVSLTIPGGTVDGVSAWIPDLPTFTQGENVLLFLREGYDRVGDPAVGVNQGVFRIVADPATGGEAVLNAEQQIVIAIENDRVITRRNPRATIASTQLVPGNAGVPTPDRPGIAASATPEVSRFLTSTEPPMAVAAFLSAVTARLAR